jgi:hypothetical protein
MPEESLETQELRERLEQDMERLEEAAERSTPRWTSYLSLCTAIVAVFAAIASLESGSFSNEALIEKNQAVLQQSRASDQWNFYQAKGLKAALAATQAEMIAASNAELATRLREEAARYRGEQEAIEKAARELEHAVEESNGKAEYWLGRHHRFALSVTVFQIAIALSAIAALTRRRLLFTIGVFVSLAGLGLFALGFLA